MQILVVVAMIQLGSLKTDVEKGFMGTALVHELVDPECCVCTDVNWPCVSSYRSTVAGQDMSNTRKGSRFIFLHPVTIQKRKALFRDRQRKETRNRRRPAWEEFSLLFHSDPVAESCPQQDEPSHVSCDTPESDRPEKGWRRWESTSTAHLGANQGARVRCPGDGP